MQLTIFLYFAILTIVIISNNLPYLILWLCFGIVILSLIPVSRNIKIKKTKQGIENNQIKININKAPYYIIEQLPNFTRISAKKAVWLRKHMGQYLSIDDFCEKNNINKKETIKDYLTI